MIIGGVHLMLLLNWRYRIEGKLQFVDNHRIIRVLNCERKY